MEDPQETEISASEILPWLWLGNQAASQSSEFLAEKGISVVFNCTKHIPCKFIGEKKYYRIAVNDPGPVSIDMSDNIYMAKILHLTVDTLEKHKQSGDKVLVHCHAGMQRSAAVVLAYLIKHYFIGDKKSRFVKAFKHIMHKRELAFNYGVSINFRPAVEYFMTYSN